MPAAIAEIFELVEKIGRGLACNAREIHLIGRAPYRRRGSRAVAGSAGLHAFGSVLSEAVIEQTQAEAKDSKKK